MLTDAGDAYFSFDPMQTFDGQIRQFQTAARLALLASTVSILPDCQFLSVAGYSPSAAL